MTQVVIIEYNAGNSLSVASALRRLGAEVTLSSDPEKIKSADKVIFPGVGHAASALKSLKSKELDHVIKNLTQPVLGICLGMQLACSFCEEGEVEAFNLIDAECIRFRDIELKVPHVGWNQVSHDGNNLFNTIPDKSFFYFVHSYHVPVVAETIASCDYGKPFSASIQKNNFYGVQFHPEKSAEYGEKLLSNFLSL